MDNLNSKTSTRWAGFPPPQATQRQPPTPPPAPGDTTSVPLDPDKPSVELIATRTVSLDWNDVAGAQSYEVEFLTNDWVLLSPDAAVNGISISFAGSSATVSNLPGDYNYYIFAVRARNSAGASKWSNYNYVHVPWSAREYPAGSFHRRERPAGPDAARVGHNSDVTTTQRVRNQRDTSCDYAYFKQCRRRRSLERSHSHHQAGEMAGER